MCICPIATILKLCSVCLLEYKREDQWSYKRSPEICCIYQYTCLNIMVFNPSAGADEALGPFCSFFFSEYKRENNIHLPTADGSVQNYSRTCIKRPLKGRTENGLLVKVVF